MNEITMKMNMDELILMALREDISSEDITTNSVMREKNWEQFSLSVSRTELLRDLGYFKELLSFWTEI